MPTITARLLRSTHTILASLLAFSAALIAAHAQPSGGPPQGWIQRVNVGAVYQGDADLDDGGSFNVARYFIGAEFLRVLDKGTAIGFSLAAGFDTYDFTEVVAPWEDVSRVEASFTYARDLSADWAIRLTPTIQSSFADGASMTDGILAGLIASATHEFSPEFSLGLGFAAFTGLEETRVFPFLAITWKVSETWTVQNPFRPGPAGPAGIEIARSGATWGFAFGGAYRSFRFRLEDDGPTTPGGIGEYTGVPVFLRASRKFNKSWELDLYAGMLVGGRLEVEDEDGRGAGKSDFDPAPLVAFTLNGRF